MFDKILVADRGEIALRVIRSCKELGIPTVAIHSEADGNSLHIGLADEDVCIGPPPGDQSYRNYSRVLSAADITNADAIHPGYGPLAENAEFAELCRSCGITFIGPSVESIRTMGDKASARAAMESAGVPTSPGTGILQDFGEAKEAAKEIGYPVRLKAAAGGGGRGMRTVESEGDLEYAWQVAHTEAAAAFSSGHLYLEKEIVNPRHVEVQVMGDQHGKVLHVGERECSIQRRHQKLIEESPSPAVDPELRARMMQAAVKGAAAASYYGAGTVEFLLSDTNEFYFLEMNTRIQVEHPVTEMVTGLDLIKQQVQVAAGEKLPLEQEDVVFEGHAIECRINAEDPAHDFRPSPGKITAFHVPGGPGVRVDTHAYTGYLIPSQYDSLLAKLIVYGPTREDAVARMLRALAEFVIEGVPTTIPFHREAIAHPDFKAGTFSTEFVQNLNS
ncbi:MAG: acetyl-CoA carboxylase biotin carboxylase subunit [Gemmatimonadetes bacterium]|nr:acetyl-CoA carboxylase biotin carboxylase subunit [Gemmatimonadota bacterium]HCK08501.1 acetyl-CoA carboxylase biotin carboxylase subunit [Candidatus Latescibacterota bacterium]